MASQNVISGIRYIQFAVIASAPKKSNVGHICNIEKFSKKCYIRYTLYLEFVESGLRHIRYWLCYCRRGLLSTFYLEL